MRPQLIGYDKADTRFQVLDRLADPSPIERVQSQNIIGKKDLYLSPELYKKLQGRDKAMKYVP